MAVLKRSSNGDDAYFALPPAEDIETRSYSSMACPKKETMAILQVGYSVFCPLKAIAMIDFN